MVDGFPMQDRDPPSAHMVDGACRVSETEGGEEVILTRERLLKHYTKGAFS